MSDDRELLELAATAAGNGAQWDNPERGMMVLSESGFDVDRWNPLTDDGDALRLAVKLKINVVWGANYVIADAVQLPTVNNANDPYAATRRAIVRAAAERRWRRCR